ncbi:hypothetical protein E3P96_03731 [Wallemia ichthyophaga]|nr:hypothetical protein E3P96_03731 [Wallemia ichthyophaga]TIB56682.1 hypothetical protein E3P79_03359 [Wallemia ichthyophaga]
MSDPVVHLGSLNQFMDGGRLLKRECGCAPCKLVAPVFKKLAESTPGVQFASFDVDEAGDIAEHLSIRSMPTFYLFKDGEKKDSFSGAAPPMLQGFVKKAAELSQ